ncbi:MAG TPA: twin-arginine translocase TatA/TatE family subunit [Solirubrobacteraceae bacterium]|jgi:sec-independent protein translocase protein TatA|nr:twin-arginine translocase TatA/TatE family subunit [Solirubrobacteraceae bacterium]
MGLDNPLHIAFLLIVLLLVFGAKRLPEIGRSVGAGMREFKDSISGIGSDHHMLAQQPQPQAPPATVAVQAQPVVAQPPQAQAPVAVQAQPVATPAPAVAEAPAAAAPAEPAQQA